jgi:hypothetical protein
MGDWAMKEANQPSEDKARNVKANFLIKIGEYKEFISILIFFAGGLFWIYGFFATKNQVIEIRNGTDYQVSKLTCVLEHNVKMLRGKMEFQYYTDLLDENKQEIREVRRDIRKYKKEGGGYSDSEDKLLDLEEQRVEFKKERGKFKQTMEAALDQLTNDGCTKTHNKASNPKS